MSCVDKTLADYAGDWNEKEVHEQIMEALSKVAGSLGDYFYINGNYHFWQITELPKGEPERIARRGNHEEILYMIHQYGRTKCNVDRRFLCWSSHNNEDGALLSDEVQQIILERNNPKEIAAFVQYHGFAPAGQDIILDRGDHKEIMRYLEHHGFAPKQQCRLWERGIKKEIELHIKQHGCCDELLDAFFDKLEKGQERSAFFEYIKLHEFPEAYQIRMLRCVDGEMFEAYISKYGLWRGAHADLVRERSVEEIISYIHKHRFLGPEGEWALVSRHVTRLTVYYIKCRVNKGNDTLLYQLLKVEPLDYEALSVYFLKMDFSRSFVEEEDFRLIKEGSNDMIMKRIEKSALDNKCLAALFFRGKRAEFEAYVRKWVKR